jgi:hypothetical protein
MDANLLTEFKQNYCADDCHKLLNELLLASMSSTTLDSNADMRSNMCSFILDLQSLLPELLKD